MGDQFDDKENETVSEAVQRRGGMYGQEFRDIDLRRADEGGRKSYDVKGLWQRHHEIVNLAVRGFSQVDIAKIVGCCPATVSNTLNGELGEKKLSELREKRDDEAKVVAENIRVLTDKALTTYHEILDNEGGEATAKERIDVSNTVVLELSGLKVASKHVGITLSADEIEQFKVRGRLAAQEIDVTPEED